jgi:LmbE family N-acetylglucosaminyl deacetylase
VSGRRTLWAAGVLAAALLAGCTPAPPSAPPPDTTSAGEPTHLDVLYIGAHPDDEASTLSTLGQWARSGARLGVLTVTRGEGGGNAVGPEEGPALGLLREGEERTAVGLAGITDVINLDKVDFFYTVSAPLTGQVWDERDTLARVVRVVRQTRPNVLVTMDPAPTPGNHGNHQQAARLAVEAYFAAADPTAFPEQLTAEGLHAFAPAKILRTGAVGASGATGPAGPAGASGPDRATGATGPDCPSTFIPADPSQGVFGVWSGAAAPGGRTWAAVERDAQRRYATQGWAGMLDVPADPAQLGCDRFTQIDSRVPYPAPGTPAAASPTAILAGTGPDAPRMRIEAPFDLTAGEPAQLTVRASGGPPGPLVLTTPAGWTVSGGTPDGTGATAFSVTPPADAVPGGRARLVATGPAGYTARAVRIVPPVEVTAGPLPQVAEFDAWADTHGVPWLRGTVGSVATVASGGSRTVPVTVTNRSDHPRSGTVTVAPPAGFVTVAPAVKPFPELAPGESTTVPFTLVNTDPALPTADQGGDHGYQLTVTSADGASSTAWAALELVPATVVAAVSAPPVVDGVRSAGEYPGPPLELSRRWEGEPCATPDDCSATGWLARSGDVLDVFVEVRDSVHGTVLATADCKRHWRTDSVEIAVDPSGTSENTATTMKLAVLPYTAEGPPCAERDADNHQGPAASTAPGVRLASTVTPAGYTVEAAIPLTALPGAVDPDRMGLDLLVYDSDTADRTGQTRIGWSTWAGVQGDPYRWGRVSLPGYPAAGGSAPPPPMVPREALASSASPASIEQAVRLHLPLSGEPATARQDSGWLTTARPVAGSGVEVTLTSTGAGTATVFVRDSGGTAATLTVPVDGAGSRTVRVPLGRPLGGEPYALAAWTGDTGSLASRVPVR